MSNTGDNKTVETAEASNFIEKIIEEDLSRGSTVPRKWCGHPAPYSEQEKGQEDTARIRTRFPPEPNGYLHIGHAKSICLNFGLARKFGGCCHLRFDDTNPGKESSEYVESIKESVKWLGFDWEENGRSNLFFASSYFKWMYQFAEYLIRIGYAYVDEQTQEQMKENRGTLTEPGRNSPFRDRDPEESLRLFREMKEGKHPEGSMVLRAKIDMASPNVNLRDPAIYRIRFAEHQETGNEWCIYPMYTFAHPIEDSLENITHSICTLEFEDQRAFYDWALERIVPLLRTPQFEEAGRVLRAMASGSDDRADAFLAACVANRAKLGSSEPERRAAAILDRHAEAGTSPARGTEDARSLFALMLERTELFTPLLQHALDVVRPNFFLLSHQHEFNRLNLSNVVLSKRKLISLVKEGLVDGWDDPRMPTLMGLRRRGYTPASVRNFVKKCGVSRVAGGSIDYSVLENSLREDLDDKAPRRMAVLRPLKLVIDNYPQGGSELVRASNHPKKPEMGERDVPFSGELWIEESDFALDPPKGFKRLTLPKDGSPARKVRLRAAYIIEPVSCEKDESGRVTVVHARYFPETKSGTAGSETVKAKATIHWVDAKQGVPAEFRIYGRLFEVEHPEAEDADYRTLINPHAKQVLKGFVEPALAQARGDDKFQFERTGYFVADRVDHAAGRPVFNLAVTLRDSKGKL
ncbi:glutamine--tRNA ligase [Mesosutterella sp. AGMB02718]|uniref:50S ribosomal protein L25 n=1 Tax=Mesosutterella faecium TaxID=2925194 RepID=A0ABT7IMA6_9BURK|nr:glutamine--tRNA ligase [Mesosutterella sp. AGMB02718]MDL2059115.1 glutamine--tRNA ligase [Mesosutterella sp. AGMB02718]